MDLPRSLTFVDVETTGLSPIRHRVIDIGILRVEDGKIAEKYETLINPHTRIPPEIASFTGITQEQVDRAPTFDEIKPRLRELLYDSVFVAHNARFDYGFLKQEFMRFGDNFRSKTLCTVRLSRKLMPELPSHSLDSIIDYCGIPCANRHRALPDAQATYQLFNFMLERHGSTTLGQAIKEVTKRSSLPRFLSEEDISRLPEGPGVYIFYNGDGLALYVGKSINVKERILSHFSADHQSVKDMKISQTIKRVDAIETAGELSALLLESQLVKKLNPLYNSQLRRSRNLIAAVKISNYTTYDTVQLVDMDQVRPERLSDILAIFKSRKKALEALNESAKEYRLCPALMGMSSASRPCFNYQIGKCRGACINKENFLAYNLRLITAFSSTRIPRWPYMGPIAITEEQNDKQETHIIHNWCLAGSYGDGNPKHHSRNKVTFDWDALKIIKRFLDKPNRYAKVRVIPKGSEINYY